MNSKPTYVAADKLPPSVYEREISEEECTKENLLQQIKHVGQKTLDSSKRSLELLFESEKIGIETAQALSVQREKLENTEKQLDDTDSTLKDTQKNINGIESVFSSIKQWWGAPQQPAGDKGNSKQIVPSSTECPMEQSNPALRKNLSSAVENGGMMSSNLSREKQQNQSLGDEIGGQNDAIDRLSAKADKSESRIVAANERVQRLLKR